LNQLLVIIFTVIILGISVEEGFAEETIQVEIKYTNGDIADFNAMKIIVYQNFDEIPFIEKKLSSNPDSITIDANNRYKIEVYANGMYSDVGYIQPNNKLDKIDITIPLSGGVNFEVYYKDGKTPIKNAKVVLKSNNNEIWGDALTNDQGETRRFWLQSTTQQGDHYTADVYLGELFLKSHFPITLSPGIAFTEKITTNVPKVIDELISINLFDGSKKITSKNGNYKIILNHIGTKEKISSNLDFRGNAYFSNVKSGSYDVKIESSSIGENILWPQRIINMIGDSNQFNIFKDTEKNINAENPILNCNCISFRLDDVQDYWLSDTQIRIIDLFEEKNIPLSVGVIGNAIGQDDEITTKIKENLDADNIEIVNHSWDNNVLVGIDSKIQKEKILKTNKKIFDVFGVTPTAFIPPQNLYDENTIRILIQNDFSHLIGHVEENIDIFSINNYFYNVPATSETALLADDSNWELNDNTVILEKTIQSLSENGYAIIMLHPQEFSLDSSGKYGEPNEETLSSLSLLLDSITQLDSNLVKISNVKPNESISSKNSEENPIEKTDDEIDSCNCIAFRLDDVQDYWLNDVQIKIIKTFLDKNTPLTVGILANAFGNDQKLTNFVKENIIENGGKIEVATKGIGLTPFTNLNKNEQNQNLKESLDLIEEKLDTRSKIFIPPDNKFNSDTYEILEENKITHISTSLIAGETPPFEFQNQKIYRFP
ncbi:MAG: DUF2334 domain-containing protein, partial [Nitrosopumilus sp.]|nr:DUF2334 domain-containing protein [Nitrosopumilus sp.]NNL52690.1 DUF2334 domain-containing protein [Nitrosopumilus sp.]